MRDQFWCQIFDPRRHQKQRHAMEHGTFEGILVSMQSCKRADIERYLHLLLGFYHTVLIIHTDIK